MEPLTDPIFNTAEGDSVQESDSLTIPVLQERLHLRKNVRQTGAVQIRKVVNEREEVVEDILESETVDVERVPMHLVVDSAPPVRVEGDVTIIPVVREVLILTKQLQVVEEIRITHRKSSIETSERVTLRTEEVRVTRTFAPDSQDVGTFNKRNK